MNQGSPTIAASQSHAADSGDLAYRVDVLESESQIRRVMAECLEAGDANDGARVASLFTTDGVWEETGRLARVLGTRTGRPAIARRYSAEVHPASLSAHFLTK
jgi:SnoaL-like domain